MKLVIFAIHDSKAEAFLLPFFSPNSAMGVRTFAQGCNDPGVKFCQSPGDYTLFEIGTFDDNSGTVKQLEVPVNHGLAIIHKRNVDQVVDDHG